jgi:hypothetical protein
MCFVVTDVAAADIREFISEFLSYHIFFVEES